MGAATLGWILGSPVFLTGAPAADWVRVIVCMTSVGVVEAEVGVSVMSFQPSSSFGSSDFDFSAGCGVKGVSKSVVYGDVI